MSGKAIRETLAALGVIASMVFVGMEIRTSNVQARAAAYQAIGIATAEWHDRFDGLGRISQRGAGGNRSPSVASRASGSSSAKCSTVCSTEV